MNRDQKRAAIDEMRTLFSDMDAIVLADTSGVDVNTINKVRSIFRAEGVHFRVVKNTLAKLALQGTELEGIASAFVGPTAIALKAGDPITPAKIAIEFAKDNPKFEVKGGYLPGKVLDAQGVVALSKMKGRQEMRAELLSIFKAPQTQFVGVMNTMVTQFLGVLNARADKLEG